MRCKDFRAFADDITIQCERDNEQNDEIKNAVCVQNYSSFQIEWNGFFCLPSLFRRCKVVACAMAHFLTARQPIKIFLFHIHKHLFICWTCISLF